MTSMADLASEMKRVKSEVDAVILDSILPASSRTKEIDLLYRMMRDYPSRPAKGMRPFLCVATCRAAGGKESDATLTAACLELFQNWILIHDDIEDQSVLRRGEPSLHVKFSPALALNAGDALHARMWGGLIGNYELLGAEKTVRILEEFSTMVNETTEGQHMELGWVDSGRWDLTEADYFEMCRRKTAWYTVTSPCRLGATVAGSPAAVLNELLAFGSDLGVAFQIQDDILNLVGDQKKYGKAKSDDILEGKRTLILLRLMETAGPGERERLRTIMGKKREEKDDEDVAYVISAMERHGALDYARGKARELSDRAMKTLRGIEWRGDPDSVAILESFARFAVEREW